jgi:hypothetical protein
LLPVINFCSPAQSIDNQSGHHFQNELISLVFFVMFFTISVGDWEIITNGCDGVRPNTISVGDWEIMSAEERALEPIPTTAKAERALLRASAVLLVMPLVMLHPSVLVTQLAGMVPSPTTSPIWWWGQPRYSGHC